MLVQLLLHEVRQAQTMPLFAPIPQRPPVRTAVQGVPEVAQHPGHAAGMGATAAQEPAHLHPVLSPADGHGFWGLAPANLPSGGTPPAVGRAVRHTGGTGSGLRQPQRVFHDVQTAARQDADGLHPRVPNAGTPIGWGGFTRDACPFRKGTWKKGNARMPIDCCCARGSRPC